MTTTPISRTRDAGPNRHLEVTGDTERKAASLEESGLSRQTLSSDAKLKRYLRERDDEFDFDRRIERQHRNADGRARVNTDLTENLAEHLRGTVDDSRLTGE